MKKEMEESAIEMKQGDEKNSSNQKENPSNHKPEMQSTKISPADWLTLVLLTSVNMLNYMDRTLLAGEI